LLQLLLALPQLRQRQLCGRSLIVGLRKPSAESLA
jgi:hypothetical protein